MTLFIDKTKHDWLINSPKQSFLQLLGWFLIKFFFTVRIEPMNLSLHGKYFNYTSIATVDKESCPNMPSCQIHLTFCNDK